ncbi:RagB/SusD family nutrient uptake outer membrane protein [Dysgonomonas sp. 520]|uniref:RagB/SusD family nutrient uptake outer membrane protein n=1 Tax=Dysgonomonas sp. 520 TaxID=2302931 RepID=UPI0013D288D1|nr:RagB/SusD family nutrient uptake outer membrane protein [Dysgonomonas sp. 520]NDW10234.1 RagB/SusD family nutrient uptake outer membrane protein [Dysgonomonas sp. 520]
MKKINILLILALLFVSCDDFLDTPSESSLDEAVIYSNPILAEGAIMGITMSFAETESYRGRFLPWYGLNTDIEWYNSSANYETDNGKADLAVYRAAANNSQMNSDKNAWAKMYEGVERANIAVRGLKNSGLAEPGTELGHLLGEALTLRAVIYADLVRAWGDVPARFEPISGETVYIPKSDRDVIYKQIIADLGEAAELTFWPNEHTYTKKVTRINKTFVKGLRARLCLVASGYSQRPDSDSPRLSNDPELDKSVLYPIAKQELLDLYKNSAAGSMEDDFEMVFRKLCEEDLTPGGESMWEIPFSSSRGRMAYTFAVRHQLSDQYTAMAQGGQVGPTPNLFYDYDVNDLRRDVTCVPYRWSKTNPAIQELNALNSWCFGKYRFEWMSREVTSEQDDGLRKQYMRFSEVILMLAEVTNELDGYSAAAPYLKEIRRRAFDKSLHSSKVDGYVNAITSKDAMLKAIQNEHAYEFAGEMLRKEALIRWNLLQANMEDTKERMRELRDRRDRYEDVPAVLYYRYATAADVAKNNKLVEKESLIVYGLNRGENDPVEAAKYESNIEWVGTGKLKDEKIDVLFVRDPDKYQFWPIWQTFISNSNGYLKNDYGY